MKKTVISVLLVCLLRCNYYYFAGCRMDIVLSADVSNQNDTQLGGVRDLFCQLANLVEVSEYQTRIGVQYFDSAVTRPLELRHGVSYSTVKTAISSIAVGGTVADINEALLRAEWEWRQCRYINSYDDCTFSWVRAIVIAVDEATDLRRVDVDTLRRIK